MGFNWDASPPQPYPVSAVCTRREPQAGMLIAGLGHEKAMAWGEEIVGLLYRETPSNIVLIAQSESFNPPGGGSLGTGAAWPERDLVHMVMGSDGFRAYVVDPSAPGVAFHRDCRANGFGTDIYNSNMQARCLRHHTDGSERRLLVGSVPGLLVGDPSMNVFRIDYPMGAPNRAYPDLPIRVSHETSLLCSRWKQVHNVDVRPSGHVAVATSSGLNSIDLFFSSPFNNRFYQVEGTADLASPPWSLTPNVQVQNIGGTKFRARVPAPSVPSEIYTIRARP